MIKRRNAPNGDFLASLSTATSRPAHEQQRFAGFVLSATVLMRCLPTRRTQRTDHVHRDASMSRFSARIQPG